MNHEFSLIMDKDLSYCNERNKALFLWMTGSDFLIYYLHMQLNYRWIKRNSAEEAQLWYDMLHAS